MIASGLHVSELLQSNDNFFKGLYTWAFKYFMSKRDPETKELGYTNFDNVSAIRRKIIDWMGKKKMKSTKSPSEILAPVGFQSSTKGNPAKEKAKFFRELKQYGKFKFYTDRLHYKSVERECWSKGYDAEKVTKLKQEWIASWCENKNQKYSNKVTTVQNMDKETTEEIDTWEDTYQKVLKGKTS